MKTKARIKVIGIGGSGCNTVSRMSSANLLGVELIALNTDIQDLKKTKAHYKLRIGKKITQGLGTGMDPEIGKKAALEDREEISRLLEGGDMVFITCGLGGGTGSGAVPIISEISKDLGILTIAVVTMPFSFEGVFRRKIAQSAINKIKDALDSLIIIENDRLLETLSPEAKISQAFWFCDDILRQAVQGITDLIFLPGLINVDFADIKAILRDSGTALFGMGKAKGEKRAEKAARLALESPLINISPKGARGVLFNIFGNRDVALSEIEEAARIITQEVNPEARIIFGAVQDEKLKKGEIKVTVIATGFRNRERNP